MRLLLRATSFVVPFIWRSLRPIVAGTAFLLVGVGPSSAGITAGDIETALTQQIQTVLDGVAGIDRTAVGVEVTLSEAAVAGRRVNGALRDQLGAGGIQRLRIELTIDPKQEVLEAATGAIVEVDRPSAEVQALVSIVEKMTGLNRDLGDELIVVTQSLSAVRDRNRQSADEAKRAQQELEQQQFWKNIGINVAKIIGIVVALILLRGAVRLIGRIGS